MTEQEVIALATKTAIEIYNKKYEDELVKKRERAVKNTIVLLEGYKGMREHCKDAISTAEEALTPSDLQTVLLEVFNRRGLLKIESILVSKRRTQLIIEHIDKMIKLYQECCNAIGKEYCNCIIDRYFNGKSIQEMADKYKTVPRNIYNWLEKGIDDLSIYIFGAYAL